MSIHRDLWVSTIVTCIASLLVVIMGTWLLLNVFSTRAQMMFGTVDTGSQIAFTLAGLLFVPFVLLGGIFTFYQAIKHSAIVARGVKIPVRLQVLKDDSGDSTSYSMVLVSEEAGAENLSEAIAVRPPKWLTDDLLEQTHIAEAYVDDAGYMGAFQFLQGLVWRL